MSSFLPTFYSGLALTAVALLSSNVWAQRDLKDIPVPDPKLEQATFQVPEGFEVNLFAADPMIAKPIQMNFDESGRLWVVSSEVYPHIEPGADASDRVLVLQDTDNDGVSDKTNVFAEGLLIPTGVAPGDGGVYVANSTELLHFTDTDGDFKADSKRVVLSGFGTEDTHHILHTLRWGPDGHLYFNQSIYIHSHIETPWGVRRLNAGGIWQFRPETLQLGVFMRGLVNTWGHHFDRFGQSFATDGAGGEGINYVVPGAYYLTAANAPKLLRGLNPGSPKHCGLEIVETPMLPAEWQGSAITNDFRGHRVCRFRLTEDRSGYVSHEQQEVIKSDHVAFRPIDVKLGPDGAIYVADWYNPIIQHGEVDFRDDRRDHTHGRIWRVTWKGAPKRAAKDIDSLSTPDLFQELESPGNFHRQAAKQVLRRRGSSVVAELRKWVKAIPTTEQTEHLRLEALWCFQGAMEVDTELLEQLLKAKDGRVRAAAVRVLSHWKYQVPNGSEMLSQLVNDQHPRVRLEAVRALSFSPLADSEIKIATRVPETAASIGDYQKVGRVESVMQATDHPTDRFLDYAIWLSTTELAKQWLPAFDNGEITFGDNVQHLLTAFTAVGRGAPVDRLLSRLYASTTTDAQRIQVINLIAASGTSEQIGRLVTLAVEQKDAGPLRVALAETRRRKNMAVVLPENLFEELQESGSRDLRSLGLMAMGQWQVAHAVDSLSGIATNNDANAEDRRAAAEGLFRHGDKAAQTTLQRLLADGKAPTSLRKTATRFLIGLNAATGVKGAVTLLPDLNASDHPEELIQDVLAVKGGNELFAKEIADLTIETSVAREMLRMVRESGRSYPQLEKALKTSGQIKGRKSLSAEEREQLLAMARDSASAADGEKVFRNEKLSCLKCHAIGGAGGKVGPDMVSLGGSAQPDYLLESLLNPNAKVKENYHTVVIATIEGKVLAGVQIKQSKTEVVIRTADDSIVTVPRDDIDETSPGLSLMPEGAADALTDKELASLVRFLSELGRTPEYTISRRQLARTWEVMVKTDAAAQRLNRTRRSTAATDDPALTWSRKYSTVAGTLPEQDIPIVMDRGRTPATVGFARTFLSVETEGVVSLNLNNTAGLQCWLNEVPVNVQGTMKIKVTPGIQRITFAVAHHERTAPLELETIPEDSTAVAKFVN